MNTPPPLPTSKDGWLKFTQPWPIDQTPDPRPGAGPAAPPKVRILVAEDDLISRELICMRLVKWGYEVVATADGVEAMAALRKPDAPTLAILDWMMPGMDGLEICRRSRDVDRMLYIILLTARDTKANLVEGLGAGADDYLIKPFDKDELQARILVGLRIMNLQIALDAQVKELQTASEVIRGLRLQVPL